MIKLRKLKHGGNDEGPKRCYLPYKLTWKYPECDEENVVDFRDQYIMHPPLNGETFSYTVECMTDFGNGSWCEYSQDVQLSAYVKLAIEED